MVAINKIRLERRCEAMRWWEKFKEHAETIVAMFAIVAVFITVGKYLKELEYVSDKIDETNTQITEMKNDIDGRFESVNEQVAQMQNQVFILAGADPALVGVSVSDEFKYSIMQCCGTLDSFVVSGASIQYSSVIGSNSEGKDLTVEDVAQKKLLLPYIEDGKECFFYGQVDQYGYWDGECIINVYSDGYLELITEAVYDAGDLLTFKQAFPNKDKKTQDVWYFSKRTVKDGFSVGETISYFRNGNYAQSFSYDEVTAADILTIDEFYRRIDSELVLEGYYFGNTSNGKYNDVTGTAYMAKYFEDGTVRTLYIGNFQDGTFEDHTGNAWMIGRLKSDKAYSYYKGPFSNGGASYDPDKAPQYWEMDITEDRITQLLDGMTFNCQLTWSIPNV